MGQILIRSGEIVDGTGAKPFTGDVLVDGGKIKKIVRNGEALPDTDTVIDASGKFVAPGFIDVHSHAEWIVAEDGHKELMNSFPEQGITTVVGGNCGIGPAPLNQYSGKMVNQFSPLFTQLPLECQWSSFGEFCSFLQDRKPIVNIAQLAGHSILRYHTGRTDHQPLKSDELSSCIYQMEKAFDEGACGVSFGLGYYPGMLVPDEEVEALFRIAANHNKPVTVHTKALTRFSPAYPLYRGLRQSHFAISLNEVIRAAEKTGATLQISHFMLNGRKSWKCVDECLDVVNQAARRGVDVMFDTIPYTCSNTLIMAMVPMWMMDMIPEGFGKLSNRLRIRLEHAIGFSLAGFSYGDMQLMHSVNPELASLYGKNIAEIGEVWGVSPFRAFLMLCEKTYGLALMLYHTANGDNGYEAPLDTIIAHDLSLYGTDAINKVGSWTNPAETGTFPKLIGHYSRDRKLFSLEGIIKKITKDSAERFGLNDRGILKEGKAADIVVFDYGTISDNPVPGRMKAGKPSGIEWVLVNGEVTVKDGCTVENERFGNVLR